LPIGEGRIDLQGILTALVELTCTGRDACQRRVNHSPEKRRDAASTTHNFFTCLDQFDPPSL
jgi:hypothetical protein